MYVQFIDDDAGVTLASMSTLSEAFKVLNLKRNTTVVFDRGGFQYHGKVKALAEAAREVGLIF